MLKIRFLKTPTKGHQVAAVSKTFHFWKYYYRPPWVFLLHIVQVILILWAYFSLINPTVTNLYKIRSMFLSIMFPSTDDDIPFASTEEIQNALDNFLDKIEASFKDSFQNFYFSNPKKPVTFHIYWLNGSVIEYPSIELTSDIFRHIRSFDCTCSFMLFDQDGLYPGCTQWHLQFAVKVALGSYLFYLEPSLTSSECPVYIVSSSEMSRSYDPDTTFLTTKAVKTKKSNHSLYTHTNNTIKGLASNIHFNISENSSASIKNESDVFIYAHEERNNINDCSDKKSNNNNQKEIDIQNSTNTTTHSVQNISQYKSKGENININNEYSINQFMANTINSKMNSNINIDKNKRKSTNRRIKTSKFSFFKRKRLFYKTNTNFQPNRPNIFTITSKGIPEVEESPFSVPHFNRQKLTFYNNFIKFGFLFLFIAIFDAMTIWSNVLEAFSRHLHLIRTNPVYEDLDPYEQFHSTIGFWNPIFLISELFMIVMGIVFLADSQRFTQYLPTSSTMFYGFSSFLIVSTVARWLRDFPACYALVYIIRQAFIKLMEIVIGIAPIVLSIVMLMIFLFGYVGQVTESMIVLVENILSVTFGDMISDYYLSLTDGSLTYNILSFIFCTISTAIAVWLFFTSFTAQMTSIYSEQVSSLVESDSSD